jgi:uncharacterized membrane protein YjdF
MFIIIAVMGTVPLLVLPFFAHPETANYRYSFLFLIPILWGTVRLGPRIHLHALHFALFALALVLHDLGALGFYYREFYGLAFDTYVHFYFGMVGALILERGFRRGLGLTGWKAWLATVVFLLGLGALHELMELGSTLGLGKGVGMYWMDDPDRFDTQKDLFNNLCGSLVALSAAWAVRRLREAKTQYA